MCVCVFWGREMEIPLNPFSSLSLMSWNSDWGSELSIGKPGRTVGGTAAQRETDGREWRREAQGWYGPSSALIFHFYLFSLSWPWRETHRLLWRELDFDCFYSSKFGRCPAVYSYFFSFLFFLFSRCLFLLIIHCFCFFFFFL